MKPYRCHNKASKFIVHSGSFPSSSSHQLGGYSAWQMTLAKSWRSAQHGLPPSDVNRIFRNMKTHLIIKPTTNARKCLQSSSFSHSRSTVHPFGVCMIFDANLTDVFVKIVARASCIFCQKSCYLV